uniref:Uncharacterized protein n=1 Tax=Arundo donax TaxID=35708 RepID=A0A0A9AV71_ARUDO
MMVHGYFIVTMPHISDFFFSANALLPDRIKDCYFMLISVFCKGKQLHSL